MLGFAWLALRQAQEALKNGRLEEAHRLLCQGAAEGHRKSWALLREIGKGFVDRGQRHLRHQDAPAAWNDLIAAEQLGINNSTAGKLRRDLALHGLQEAWALLKAGEPARAIELMSQLRHRSVHHPDLALLEEAGKGWMRAQDLASRGEFAQAQQAMDRVNNLLRSSRLGALAPDAVTPRKSHGAASTVGKVCLDRAEEFAASLERKKHAFAVLLVRLHEAVEAKNWPEVLKASEQALAFAPQHPEARRARAQAWKVIEPATMPSPAAGRNLAVDTDEKPRRGERFLLWIDGVGGFLVCLGNRVTLGQATPDAYVDIPLYADVSRMHATVARDAEGYVLEANRSLMVNGKPAERALLRSGDRIMLGGSCQLLFRQPVPVSTTARLDLASGHRLPLTVDGVVLMADTLVMNSGPQAHVTIPDLEKPIVLYRHKDQLGIRYAGSFAIDGGACRDRGILPELRPGSGASPQGGSRSTMSVTGEDFAFAIEPVAPGLGRI